MASFWAVDFLWKNKKPGLKLFEFAEVGNSKKKKRRDLRLWSWSFKSLPRECHVFFCSPGFACSWTIFWHLEELKKKREEFPRNQKGHGKWKGLTKTSSIPMWSSETCGMVPADNSSIYPQQKWNSKIWHTYIVLPTQYKCISSSNIFDMLTFKFMLKKTQQVFLPPQNKTNPILLIVELFAMRGSDDGCSDMSRQGRQGRCLLDELVKKCEMNSINIGVVFNWSGWAMGFSGLFPMMWSINSRTP